MSEPASIELLLGYANALPGKEQSKIAQNIFRACAEIERARKAPTLETAKRLAAFGIRPWASITPAEQQEINALLIKGWTWELARLLLAFEQHQNGPTTTIVQEKL